MLSGARLSMGGYASPSTARERMGGSSVPGYPSPALTPGSVPSASSSSEYPVPHHTSFWSPITPPDGVDHLGHAAAAAAAAGGGGGTGFERTGGLDMKSGGEGGSGRGPPTLVQMQVGLFCQFVPISVKSIRSTYGVNAC
jgi:hypothetical protein